MPDAARRRYAERTKVTVTTSRAEIEAALRKAGAVRIIALDEPGEACVVFMLGGRLIRFNIPVAAAGTEQDRCVAWRAALLIVKAKIEAVAQGVATAEQEWLPHVVLPDGQTVAQWIEPHLRLAYERGTMPEPPLMLGGPKPS